MSGRVAILGANGFIGTRIVETFVLNSFKQVRTIVRHVSGLALPQRFDIECRIADAFDPQALRHAFQGCDSVVHAVGGDTRTIVGTVEPIYTAAEAAGVRRLVYLSTASVHGQAPVPGSDESMPLNERQCIPYNNAKVKAERKLLSLRAKSNVEIVLLRPGIVFGPRSQWIAGFADELLTGRTCVVEGAHGICNSIYIDNLVHAVRLALTARGADGEAFLIGDEERVTWRDLYEPIATALGFSFEQVRSVTWTAGNTSTLDRLRAFRHSAAMRTILPFFPARLKHAVASGLAAWLQFRPNGSSFSPGIQEATPAPDLERALLHRCAWKFPHEKATRLLGYTPQVSFAEGCRRSVAWLAFAGYPVRSVESRPFDA